MEHLSPLPWRKSEVLEVADGEHLWIVDANEMDVAMITDRHRDTPELDKQDRLNFELIVKAANNHEALVAALESAEKTFERLEATLGSMGIGPLFARLAKNKIRTALEAN